MVLDTSECFIRWLIIPDCYSGNHIYGMEAQTTFTDSCEDCDVVLIEVVWRRQEGKFSEANFSPTQCRFSGFRVEKTFLRVLWSYMRRVDLDVTPGKANSC